MSLKYESSSEPLHISVPSSLGSGRRHLGGLSLAVEALSLMIDTRGTSLGGVPREQKMLKGHLPRVIHHQVYNVYEDNRLK